MSATVNRLPPHPDWAIADGGFPSADAKAFAIGWIGASHAPPAFARGAFKIAYGLDQGVGPLRLAALTGAPLDAVKAFIAGVEAAQAEMDADRELPDEEWDAKYG